MFNKNKCFQRDKPRANRPKQRKTSWPWMLAALVRLVIDVRSEDVCGNQKNFHQWSSLLDINFQMMHASDKFIAVGATTTQADRFYQPTYKNMLPADNEGALLSIFSSNVDDSTEPLKATLISTISSGTVSVYGFKAIHMGSIQANAVLDTSNDNFGRNTYLVTYYESNKETVNRCTGIDGATGKRTLPPCYLRNQLQILKLTSNAPIYNIMLTSNNRVWLVGE